MGIAFGNAIDICNRALDHCGADAIDATLGFSEGSQNARICNRVYHKLRQAELRRNTWRFTIKHAILRALDANTMLLAPALWASTTTYFVGSIVSDSTGQLWISRIPNNRGNQPETSSTALWQEYFGPMSVMLYSSTTTYGLGELVYTTAGDGTYRVYLSLQAANADNPATATAWSATTTYFQNQVVTQSAVAYMSLLDFNLNHAPPNATYWTTVFTGGIGSMKWLQIGGAEFPMGVGLIRPNLIYPIGYGPSTADSVRNVFRLPANYLRPAPQDPKAGSNSVIGAPTNAVYTDWLFEGDYIVSMQADPIIFRFVADTVDVPAMDAMFCEGLGARIGMEICERLTQSSAKVKVCADFYKLMMGEARMVNAVEIGSEEPALDDFIACRA